MNDRFKFRAWDKINEEWLNIPHLSLDVESGLLNGFFDYEEAAKRRYVLEQCTGLRDKNGKLIYEGDIVKAFGFKDYYKLVCRFRDSSFCLDHIDGSPYNFAHSVSPVEVIGNIHENADLLENEE